jgi:hypothetical protein
VEIAHSTSGIGCGGDAGVAGATPSRRRRGAGGDGGGMAARGCHGTTRAKPQQLEDWEAIGVGIWRSDGARWQRAETLAAGGLGTAVREGGGQISAVVGWIRRSWFPYEHRRRPEWSELAGASRRRHRIGGQEGALCVR